MSREVTVVTDSFAATPGLDTGVSHAVAMAVGEGRLGETFRIHRAGSVVAFGRQDLLEPGYRKAVAHARGLGFEAVERLAGGRAAVFHPGTIAFSWAIPTPEPRTGIHERFSALASVITDGLRSLGADARIGELPGEYCPGAFSVNLEGRSKVMGVGQRLVRRAAHVGGVVVVEGADRIREVLVPVYDALGIEWDPSTAGDIAAAVPGATVDVVIDAILDRLADDHQLVDGSLPAEVVSHGRRLTPQHLSPDDTAP